MSEGSGVAGGLRGLLRLPSPTGPILAKELRVSARRRRNYVLRGAYVVLLTIFVVLVWLGTVHSGSYYGGVAYTASRMSMAGKTIIVAVVWFQFCLVQLLAVVMLSNSISEEISRRTLGVLMTTPISSFQIVVGKLVSKLWQLLVLLAISLPILAVVRIFGGVPWDFVVAGMCITFAAAVHAGAWSMFFSIFARRSYAAIFGAIFMLGVLYALVPWMVYAILDLAYRRVPEASFFSGLAFFNPPIALGLLSESLMRPGWAAGRLTVSWPGLCAIMLGVAAAVLGVCVLFVRRVALRQAVGHVRLRRPHFWEVLWAGGSDRRPVGRATGKIRRVGARPVLWREMRSGVLWRGWFTKSCVVLGALALGLSYLLVAAENELDDRGTHMAYVCIFVGLGVLATLVISATAVASEKESRSLPLLLATTMSDWEIILSKGAGVVRKTWLIWALLAAHVVIFSNCGFLREWMLFVHLALLVAWVLVFFTATGLYFSARFRRTTTAVVMNIALAVTLYVVAPLFVVLLANISNSSLRKPVGWMLNFNPLVQAVAITEGAARWSWYWRHRS